MVKKDEEIIDPDELEEETDEDEDVNNFIDDWEEDEDEIDPLDQ